MAPSAAADDFSDKPHCTACCVVAVTVSGARQHYFSIVIW